MNIKELKGKHIECLNEEHGKEILEFYKSIGVDTDGYFGECTRESDDEYRYYGICKDIYFSNRLKDELEIITLDEAKELIKPKTFPRLMEVSDQEDFQHDNYVIRMVLHISNDYYKYTTICGRYKNQLETGEPCDTTKYKYAREIRPTLNITEEMIAEKFGTTKFKIV